MTRKRLVFTDLIFVIAVALLCFATDGFHKPALMIIFLIGFTLIASVKRHVRYYKLNKKIY